MSDETVSRRRFNKLRSWSHCGGITVSQSRALCVCRTAGADEAAGASANMQPAHPGRTLKESQDQTPAPPPLPGGFAALNRTERRMMAVHVLCSLLHRSPGSGSCFFIQVIR